MAQDNGNGIRVPKWLWQLWKNAIQWALLVGVPAVFVAGFQLYGEIKMNRADIEEVNERINLIGERVDAAIASALRATSISDRIVIIEEDMRDMGTDVNEARDARRFIYTTIQTLEGRVDTLHDFAGADALDRLRNEVNFLGDIHGIQSFGAVLEGYEWSPHTGPMGPR